MLWTFLQQAARCQFDFLCLPRNSKRPLTISIRTRLAYRLSWWRMCVEMCWVFPAEKSILSFQQHKTATHRNRPKKSIASQWNSQAPSNQLHVRPQLVFGLARVGKSSTNRMQTMCPLGYVIRLQAPWTSRSCWGPWVLLPCEQPPTLPFSQNAWHTSRVVIHFESHEQCEEMWRISIELYRMIQMTQNV